LFFPWVHSYYYFAVTDFLPKLPACLQKT
jgi:hypothetical protein